MGFFLLWSVLWFKLYVFLDLKIFLGWAIWPMDLLELFWSSIVRRLSFRPSVRSSVCQSIYLLTFLIFDFFSRTTGLILTKLGTKHHWVMGIQVYSNDWPCLFPRWDNKEIVKIHWWTLKIFFFRTTGPISTKLGTKHPWVTGIHVSSNEGPRPFLRVDNKEIAKVQRWTSQVHRVNFNQN